MNAAAKVDQVDNDEELDDKVEGAAVEGPDFLNMSDDEIMKMDSPTAVVPAKVEAKLEEPAKVEDKPKEGVAADVDADKAEDAAEAAAEAVAAAAKAAEPKKEEKPKPVAAKVEDKPAAAKAEKEEKKVEGEAKTEEKKEEPAKLDFEAEYKRLLTPFKANGRDIQVESVDDAIALMQMGANYNKKMAALKPNLKLMKMLENNGFLSEDKIGFLIDLGKKDPGAIQKLVKDSGIDPMELGDAEKAKAYKQTAYAVDDRQMELDTVLDELKDSPTYTRTLQVVSNKWDVASKQVFSEQPQLLKVIDSHIASGIFDLISTKLDKERMLGRLAGLSDIEAYRQVGDAIQAQGGFSHLSPAPAAKTAAPTAEVIVEPKPKKVDDDKLKDKKRAASSTQPAVPATLAQDFNPLSMSDDEFLKVANARYR